MTAVAASNFKYNNAGDQNKVTATLTDVATGETFTPPGMKIVEDWSWAPVSAATDALMVVLTVGNLMTLTPVSSGSQDGVITVYGR